MTAEHIRTLSQPPSVRGRTERSSGSALEDLSRTHYAKHLPGAWKHVSRPRTAPGRGGGGSARRVSLQNVYAKGRVKRGGRARRRKEGVRKEAVAGGGELSITLKNEPLEPRKGKPGERLTARAGHERTTLPYSFRT